MPWIDKDKCTGCELCVDYCPGSAISIEDEKAIIDMDKCIRCGECHGICPQEAVRHDSEKIPEEIENNVEKVKGYIKHFDSEEKKQACLKRCMNSFKKEKTVAEKILLQLENMMNVK